MVGHLSKTDVFIIDLDYDLLVFLNSITVVVILWQTLGT